MKQLNLKNVLVGALLTSTLGLMSLSVQAAPTTTTNAAISPAVITNSADVQVTKVAYGSRGYRGGRGGIGFRSGFARPRAYGYRARGYRPGRFYGGPRSRLIRPYRSYNTRPGFSFSYNGGY